MDLQELKKRLRDTKHHPWEICTEAADAIEQLQRELEEARKVQDAAANLIKVKGRHHTEMAYQQLVSALDAARQQKS